MPLDHTKNMLETLKYYSDCQITQTFTKDQSQILVVRYIKESHSFEVTYTGTSQKRTYPSIDSAAVAIEQAIGSH
ncbi:MULTISPECIES: hypothetical protein [Bacillaceae]|uniref:Uncharacterized protein n=1 Tax=Cytobacillus firmus DS1 TaxID=1307436 RepID=W7L330_CYTFI|nr:MULTISPECIES: hypothetical protein [Bacillaceae]EWG09567.1 hypothetical protein PBF_18189 [Cytobacillus firmus DS1]PAE23533.1 hypothetical protein CHI10_17635 [Bacillus sp. 7894-2]URM32732.1 hypothetical protein LLY41_20890 [Cytobacillus firmus]